MTEIVATYKLRHKKFEDFHAEDIREFLMNIGEDNDMDLISWGTI